MCAFLKVKIICNFGISERDNRLVHMICFCGPRKIDVASHLSLTPVVKSDLIPKSQNATSSTGPPQIVKWNLNINPLLFATNVLSPPSTSYFFFFFRGVDYCMQLLYWQCSFSSQCAPLSEMLYGSPPPSTICMHLQKSNIIFNIAFNLKVNVTQLKIWKWDLFFYFMTGSLLLKQIMKVTCCCSTKLD